LPGMNARESLASLRRHCLDVPFILISSNVNEANVAEAMRFGADHVIAKQELARLPATIERSVLAAARRREDAAELRHHREHLAGLVAERTTELEAANRRLREEVLARERMESALRDSEAKYRTLVESSADGICILQDRSLQFVNLQLAAMVGYSPQALIGSDFVQFLPPEHVAAMQVFYTRVMTEDAPPPTFETAFVTTPNGRRDVSLSASRMEYESTPAAMLIVRDISDQKRVAEVLIEKERSEAFSTIAQGVAHNFTNIMAVISSYAASIADSVLAGSRTHLAAGKILDATRHAAHLTHQLMNIANQSKEGQHSSVKVVRLAKAVRDVHELIEHTLMQKQVELIVPRLETMPAVLADPTQLLDTLMNVLLNAAEAMPEGGRIKVKTIERRISRPRMNSESPGGAFVALCIRDSGVGMVRDQVARAFEPFFTTKDVGQGFGLGLSVAQSMVMSWGGWMDINSRPGRGTRVRIFMLKADETAPSAARDRPTILVVDDDCAQLSMMAATLTQAGFSVHAADSGAAAIDLYKDHANEIGLALVDWIMPGTDGKAVVQAILGRDPAARIVVVSGFSRDYTRGNLRVGAWEFLQKPFSGEELTACVEKVLA